MKMHAEEFHYLILVHCFAIIRFANFYLIRLELVHVTLRRADDGRGDCKDILYIRDLNTTMYDYSLCGSLVDFSLILSHQVQLQLRMGELEMNMPDMIGFSILYDSVGKLSPVVA